MPFTDDPRQFLTALFKAAVAQADPMKVLADHLPQKPEGRLFVIGAGKASARMAEALEVHYGPCDGYIITRYGYARECRGIEIVEAAHPVPDAAGEAATREMLARLEALALGPNDTVIALVSGGGSSLLCAPVAGISLADKQALNAALLASGAPISQMNAVRKHLSAIKGGKLAVACAPARLFTLMISDVPGDDPSMIASGPTVGDATTPQDAIRILKDWNIDVPAHVLAALGRSAPVLPTDPRLAQAVTKIIAAPSQSLEAAAALAVACDVRILGDDLEGEARELAVLHAGMARELAGSVTRPTLLLSGGECTVTRRGDGRGGPNAEYVLAAVDALAGHGQIHVLAGDTDGVDGIEEVAGAYGGPRSLETAKAQGVSVQAALDTNDAHGFFASIGGQIVTGPTLTNVNDFRAVLILPA